MSKSGKNRNAGVGFAIGSYGLWGILPVYWRQLHGLPVPEILFHRVLWSLVFFWALVSWRGRRSLLRSLLHHPKKLAVLALCAALIGANWGIYVYGVNSGRILEASLGYFVSPLMSVGVGAWFFRERLGSLRVAALVAAGLGVAILSLRVDHFPWIACALSLSFTAYGALRKSLGVEVLLASTIETTFLFLFSLPFLGFAWKGFQTGHTTYQWSFLLAAGVVTATPLWWYAEAAERLSFGLLGLLQFLSPSLQFLMGIFYGETLELQKAAAFVLIWVGIALYVADLRRTST